MRGGEGPHNVAIIAARTFRACAVQINSRRGCNACGPACGRLCGRRAPTAVRDRLLPFMARKWRNVAASGNLNARVLQVAAWLHRTVAAPARPSQSGDFSAEPRIFPGRSRQLSILSRRFFRVPRIFPPSQIASFPTAAAPPRYWSATAPRNSTQFAARSPHSIARPH